ncbi:MAG: hypothetical protein ACRD1K_12085, partial [Acidimicrobiales bacterium]
MRRRPPPSRSRPCGPEPCAITDGDLTEPPVVGTAAGPVDLGEARDIDLVVVRGSCPVCRLESSSDGVAWRPLSGRDPGVVLGRSGPGGLGRWPLRPVRVGARRRAERSGLGPRELTPGRGVGVGRVTRPAVVAVNGPTDAAVAAAAVAAGDGSGEVAGGCCWAR